MRRGGFVLLDGGSFFVTCEFGGFGGRIFFTEGFFDPKVAGDIGQALLRTTGVALAGLAIAIVIGIAWAVAMSQARWVERSLFPYAVILDATYKTNV